MYNVEGETIKFFKKDFFNDLIAFSICELTSLIIGFEFKSIVYSSKKRKRNWSKGDWSNLASDENWASLLGQKWSLVMKGQTLIWRLS